MFHIVGQLMSLSGITWQIMGPDNRTPEGVSLNFPFHGVPPSARDARRIVSEELSKQPDQDWIRIARKTWTVDLAALRERFKLPFEWLEGSFVIQPEFDLVTDSKGTLQAVLRIVIEEDDVNERETDAPESSASGLQRFLPPDLLARFEIVQHIESGGFGAVYQVVDLDSRERLALKVIANRPDALARASRELNAARTLSHPNILEVVGQHPEGHWFLMPLAERTLGQVAYARALTREECFEVASSIGAALVCAHTNNILHRDLHPDNVLRYDGKWRVADWGLAVGPDDVRLTRTKSVGGVQTWCSPEQLRDLKRADARSDLFSLGRIVQWLETRELPEVGRPGVLPATSPFASFVAATTQQEPNDRPPTVQAALSLISEPSTVLADERSERTPAVTRAGQQILSTVRSRKTLEERETANVRLGLGFKRIGGNADVHNYCLSVTLVNIARRRLEDWELEVRFPSRVFDGPTATRVAERSDKEQTLLRIVGKEIGKSLRPDDTHLLEVDYHMNYEIYDTRREIFDFSVYVRAMIDGVIDVQIDKPFEDLQNF